MWLGPGTVAGLGWVACWAALRSSAVWLSFPPCSCAVFALACWLSSLFRVSPFPSLSLGSFLCPLCALAWRATGPCLGCRWMAAEASLCCLSSSGYCSVSRWALACSLACCSSALAQSACFLARSLSLGWRLSPSVHSALSRSAPGVVLPGGFGSIWSFRFFFPRFLRLCFSSSFVGFRPFSRCPPSAGRPASSPASVYVRSSPVFGFFLFLPVLSSFGLARYVRCLLVLRVRPVFFPRLFRLRFSPVPFRFPLAFAVSIAGMPPRRRLDSRFQSVLRFFFFFVCCLCTPGFPSSISLLGSSLCFPSPQAALAPL